MPYSNPQRGPVFRQDFTGFAKNNFVSKTYLIKCSNGNKLKIVAIYSTSKLLVTIDSQSNGEACFVWSQKQVARYKILPLSLEVLDVNCIELLDQPCRP